MEKYKLWSRTIFITLVISTSLLVFLPNVLSQDLRIAFQYKKEKAPLDKQDGKDEPSKGRASLPREIKDFLEDDTKGLPSFFPNTPCRFEATDASLQNYHCIVKSRFVTAANINEIVQSHPDLLDANNTRILAHPIERFVGNLAGSTEKLLKIKLGLDLQGGIRSVFRADFESYLQRLREKIEPYIAKQEAKLETEIDEKKKKELEEEIQDARNRLSLDKIEKLQLLQSAKNVIEKRLTSQNLTEPDIRVREESYSVTVDIPGIANTDEVLAYIKDTVTVRVSHCQ